MEPTREVRFEITEIYAKNRVSEKVTYYKKRSITKEQWEYDRYHHQRKTEDLTRKVRKTKTHNVFIMLYNRSDKVQSRPQKKQVKSKIVNLDNKSYFCPNSS